MTPTAFLRTACTIAVAGALAALVSPAFGEGYRTNSRTPYVHKIDLYDQGTDKVDPKDQLEALPFSVWASCTKCHDLDTIGKGWHFNASDPKVAPGRPGEPWFWTDPETRTVLPLSYRAWKGTYRPAEVGIDDWQFVRRFGRHMPGGGMGAPAKTAGKEGAPVGRWNISGKLELGCLICHSTDPGYDAGDWATQIDRENFKWAASAASGLARVIGTTAKIPDDFDPEFPELAGPDATLPAIKYDPAKFEANGKWLMQVARTPRDERCYFCHSEHYVDYDLPPRFQTDIDVHLRSGLTCTDCHRHGLDHAVTRSYEGEENDSDNVAAGTLTCRACHIGDDASTNPLNFGGRLGAPIAEHQGLPLVHLEKLECTACHSGPFPQAVTVNVQTARAHALGIADEHRSDADPPHIVEPVFMKGASGKIGPHRMAWPSFWGKLKDGEIKPLPVAAVTKAVAPLLKVTKDEKEEYPRGWKPIQTEEIAAGLEKLQGGLAEGESAVYVTSGTAYQVRDGKVAAFKNAAAEGYAWPLAHEVRGAGQSTGALTCTDCHAKGAPFIFGKVAVDDPKRMVGGTIAEMAALHGMHETDYPKVNWFFRILIIVTMTALILHILGDLLRRMLKKKKAE